MLLLVLLTFFIVFQLIWQPTTALTPKHSNMAAAAQMNSQHNQIPIQCTVSRKI